jgi:hypothetical protein
MIAIFLCSLNTNIKTQRKLSQRIENKIDTTKIVVISFNKKKYDWIFPTGKKTKLTAKDFILIENILKKCIEEYNPKKEKQFEEIKEKHKDYKLEKENFIIDLERYKRQYIAIVNEKGETEVWVNCFCDKKEKTWKKEIILVDDGGNCFFNVKINVTKGKYYELNVNGSA